jgi:hypothetical protein
MPDLRAPGTSLGRDTVPARMGALLHGSFQRLGFKPPRQTISLVHIGQPSPHWTSSSASKTSTHLVTALIRAGAYLHLVNSHHTNAGWGKKSRLPQFDAVKVNHRITAPCIDDAHKIAASAASGRIAGTERRRPTARVGGAGGRRRSRQRRGAGLPLPPPPPPPR